MLGVGGNTSNLFRQVGSFVEPKYKGDPRMLFLGSACTMFSLLLLLSGGGVAAIDHSHRATV